MEQAIGMDDPVLDGGRGGPGVGGVPVQVAYGVGGIYLVTHEMLRLPY